MDFHQSIVQELKKTKAQAEKAIAQLSDADLHWQPEPESNSIAIIMKHIAGNMLSRWTDFLTTDGEKPNRNRDGEFVDEFKSRADLMAFWERGWSCAMSAIESLTPADMQKTVMIRSEPHSVPLAIVRQLTHYCTHVGQIVYIAKQRRGVEWKTLSMPKNKAYR
jgi:hypothetical protein